MDDLNDSLTADEWKTKYNFLKNEYKNLQSEEERLKQENCNLKRDLAVAENANKYINEELEILQSERSNAGSRLDDLRTKYEARLDDFRKENLDVAAKNESLTHKVERLTDELRTAMEVQDKSVSIAQTNVSSDSVQFHEEELQKYKECIIEIETELKVSNEKLECLESEVEELRENRECLKSTLQCKTEELEEVQTQIVILQVKNAELNTALQSKEPSGHGEKGNSLFAEVDDQRKEFHKLLCDQQQFYQRMKSDYEDCKLKIRRLKRENEEILAEMEECKSLFFSASSIFKDGQDDKINALQTENENFQKSVELLSKKSDSNIVALLNHHKHETKTLKEKFYTNLQIKSNVEEKLMKMQQECANLKLEVLELRTHLRKATTDREENKENSSPKTASPNFMQNFSKFNSTLSQITEEEVEKPSSKAKVLLFEEPKRRAAGPQFRDISLANLTPAKKKIEPEPMDKQEPTRPVERFKSGLKISKIVIPSRKKPLLEQKSNNN